VRGQLTNVKEDKVELTRLLRPVSLVVEEEKEENRRDYARSDNDGVVPGEVLVVLRGEQDEESAHRHEDRRRSSEVDPSELLTNGLLRAVSGDGVVDLLEAGDEGDEEERNLRN
jgi:hypothetical protein